MILDVDKYKKVVTMLYTKSGTCLDRRAEGKRVGDQWSWYVQDIQNKKKSYMFVSSAELIRILAKKKKLYGYRFKIFGEKKLRGTKVFFEIK